MQTIVKGRNQEVAEADRRYAELKMARLGRLFDERSEAIVELSRESHRSPEERSLVEVAVVVDGRPLRCVARASTPRAALDEVVDKLERRAVEGKKKPRLRAIPDEAKRILRTIADGTADPAAGRERGVVKVKRFAIEPMFEEDAIAAMEELGHRFYVFVNAENERLAVLYARRDGDYGLIEPTIGGPYTPGRHQARAEPSGPPSVSAGRR